MNATQEKLILDLLQRYKEKFLNVSLAGPYKEGERANELYKWQLITDCHEKTEVEIIRSFKSKNVVHVQTVYPVLTELLKNNQQQLVDCFNGLKDENLSLSERLFIFKKEMGNLCGDKFKSKANDERTAAAFLTCWNPEEYTFFITKIYQLYCNYIGQQSYETGEKYPHYLQLIAELAEIIKQDHELNDKFQNETNGLIQSDLLTAQNILWQMKDIMSIKEDKYTNFKHLLEYFVSHLEWCNNGDTSFIGYDKYIKPLLNAKKFKYSGQGWNGGQIQEQIEQWAHYEKYTICINVYGANYQSNACYLNWEGTWINVRPLWDNGHIVKLYLSKEEKSSAKEERIKTVQELSLFDNKEPNQSIRAFFDEYEKMILEYDGTYYNKYKMEQLNTLTQILTLKKNIILQGAPGTGKTYNTAALALSICGETIPEKHEDVMKRYDELQKEGRIGFCTFHQSMDYEDFVEGIKPKSLNEQITYEIEPGIFKTMCENAKNITTERKSDKIDFSKTRVFKMSLGEKGKDDAEIFDYCLENNVVGLGWGGDKDFSQCKKREDFKALDDTWGAFAMEIFKQWMQIGDVILISDGTKSVKAIARIVGDYEFHKDAPIDMCQFRKVEWLYTGDLIPISKLYDKNLSQQSIYGFYYSNKYGKPDFNGTIKVDVINDIITGKVDDKTPQNYILIIDEINRGNVSKIFGELITLLETDKRIGSDHPIKVMLPYSKESFGVPSNLYIIGTMNTTDRSVGNIDYAVRRRFAFVTLESKEEVIEEHYKNNESLKNKALVLFKAIKSFLEKHKFEMDIEDLMVGHSYFMAKDENELDLKWRYEIIPLLREYYKDGIIKQDVKANTTIDDFCIDK